MDTDATSLFVLLVPGALIPTVLLFRAFGAPSPRQLRKWASGCGVTITTENEALIRTHLGRVRRFRSVAAFPFWWIGTALVFGSDFPARHRSSRDVGVPAPASSAHHLGRCMIITVDPGHRDPPYQQIRLQVLAAIASGSLAVGSRLPTIRQLADDLDLAANTVARAYRELESDGAIESRGRRGTFIRTPRPTVGADARTRELDAVAQACVTEARRLGAPLPEIAAAFARAVAAPVH